MIVRFRPGLYRRCARPAFLLLTYTGPGMIKTLLTLRTGNAWVHVWAYHALAHTLVDTPHLVEALHIR